MPGKQHGQDIVWIEGQGETEVESKPAYTQRGPLAQR
jgi:hypothetical protein